MVKNATAMIDRLLFGSAIAVDISSTDHQFVQGKSSLYVGVTGHVVLDMGNGEESVTFTAVPAGTVLPVFFNKVKKAGTTATNMVALN